MKSQHRSRPGGVQFFRIKKLHKKFIFPVAHPFSSASGKIEHTPDIVPLLSEAIATDTAMEINLCMRMPELELKLPKRNSKLRIH